MLAYLEQDVDSSQRCNAQYKTRAIRQQALADLQQQDKEHERQQQSQRIDQQRGSNIADYEQYEVIQDTAMSDVAAD